MPDISAAEKLIINKIIQSHVPGAEIRIFGSRQRGTALPWSDLDLLIVDDGPLDINTMAELGCAFEDSDLPFRVDLLDWHRLGEEFRIQIEKQGYEIFSGE